ncbi:hypothetical protein IWX49DRAFT_571470 [Phyllosticta citricarpa]|uniref:Uncharacterized protein n=1 Tax=Phyllosticta paracitricarpa TaxID=2016321 RepID=A0ABR1MWA3_9PEZI
MTSIAISAHTHPSRTSRLNSTRRTYVKPTAQTGRQTSRQIDRPRIVASIIGVHRPSSIVHRQWRQSASMTSIPPSLQALQALAHVHLWRQSNPTQPNLTHTWTTHLAQPRNTHQQPSRPAGQEADADRVRTSVGQSTRCCAYSFSLASWMVGLALLASRRRHVRSVRQPSAEEEGR